MTNNRLNKLFSNLIEDGYTITIQKLDFEPFKLGIYEISDDSLNKKLVRRFIEHMMASYYTVAGYKMLNA